MNSAGVTMPLRPLPTMATRNSMWLAHSPSIHIDWSM